MGADVCLFEGPSFLKKDQVGEGTSQATDQMKVTLSPSCLWWVTTRLLSFYLSYTLFHFSNTMAAFLFLTGLAHPSCFVALVWCSRCDWWIPSLCLLSLPTPSPFPACSRLAAFQPQWHPSTIHIWFVCHKWVFWTLFSDQAKWKNSFLEKEFFFL